MQDNFFQVKKSLNLKGNLFLIDGPKVMGILNLTPDSFYDGGLHHTVEKAVIQAEKMLSERAHILDLGAYSSRPGAVHISASEEWERLKPVLKEITKEFPKAILSVDTFRSDVAEKAVDAGAHIINDISGGNMDPNMFKTIAKLKVPYILMHMQGTPQNMQQAPTYNQVTDDVILELSKKVNRLHQLGVADIIVDPGFGFGKTIDHNYTMMKELESFHLLGHPILVGVSRKSMIYKYLNTTPEDALIGSTVLNTIGLQKGASFLRVHDVKAAAQTIAILEKTEPQ